MAKDKLYKVEIRYVGYALVGGWRDARDLAEEIVRTELAEVHVGEVHASDVKEWDDHSLVYGPDDDVQIGDVWPKKEE